MEHGLRLGRWIEAIINISRKSNAQKIKWKNKKQWENSLVIGKVNVLEKQPQLSHNLYILSAREVNKNVI